MEATLLSEAHKRVVLYKTIDNKRMIKNTVTKGLSTELKGTRIRKCINAVNFLNF